MTAALSLALAAITEHAGADPSQQLIAAKCRGLMRGYAARWADSQYEIESVEETVESELLNPETGRRSRSFRVAGKIDVKGWYQGRRVIFDHKTTSDEIADPASPYWRQLTIEAQPTHYMLIEWLNGRKVDDAVWDVIRKPGIAPKGVAKKDLSQVTASGWHFGYQVSPESLAELRATERETLEMYEYRLAYDCTVDRPERYFQRRSVPRLDSEIHEYARELWEHGQEILHARNTERYARNSGACMAYGRPCKYLGICSGHDDVDSDKWQRKSQVHVELPTIQGDGRDVLTNSRIKSFQSCRRKHFYDYDLGIQRQDEEEAESLYFGTLLHKGLEVYLGAFIQQKEQYEHINGNSSGIDLAATVSSDTY